MTEVSENPTQITQEAKAPKKKVPGGFKKPPKRKFPAVSNALFASSL